MLIAMAI